MSKEPRVPMAAMSLSDLQREVGACVALMGVDLKDAVVIHTASGEDQLWVRPDYEKYRSAWEATFGSVPNEYHVDHLYAKQRALQYKYAYVRLVLTIGSVNTSHGGGVEKQMNKIPISTNPNPGVRYADWYQIQKLNGMILGGRKRGYLPTGKKLGKSITGGGKLRYTPAYVSRKGSTHDVTMGSKDYSAVGDLLGWLMEALVGLSNKSLVSDALERLEPSIWKAMPEAGGGASGARVSGTEQCRLLWILHRFVHVCVCRGERRRCK